MRIPGFRIARTIGTGGMGIVYLAEDVKLGRLVAIKVLSDILSENPGIRRRFFNEAKLMGGMSHPNIVVLHDFIEFRNRLALVMEYVDGTGLEKMIGEEVGPIPFEQALPLFQQILDAAGYAHKRGVIHRDLKPSNILVSSRNIAKLTDFGIAKITGEAGQTRTGTKLGTLWYMSPEQILGAEVDHRADVYSLGVTLYEMLSGRMPLNDHTTSDLHLMNAIVKDAFPDPRDYYPHIPSWLVRVVFKAISKSPGKRYSNCEEFLEALQSRENRKSAESSVVIPESSESSHTDEKEPVEQEHMQKGFRLWGWGETRYRLLWLLVPGLLVFFLLAGVFSPWYAGLRDSFQTSFSQAQSGAFSDSDTGEARITPGLVVQDSIPFGPYFQKIDQVLCLSDGRIAVWDLGRTEISFFGSRGEYQNNLNLDWNPINIPYQPMTTLPSGGIALSGGPDFRNLSVGLYDSLLVKVGELDNYGDYLPLFIAGNGMGQIAACDLKIDMQADSVGYRIVLWEDAGDCDYAVLDEPVHSFVGSLDGHESWLNPVGRIPLLAVSKDGNVLTTLGRPGFQTLYGYQASGGESILRLELSSNLYQKPEYDIRQEIELIDRITGQTQSDFQPDTLMPVISGLGIDYQNRIWVQLGIPDTLLFDVYSMDGEKLFSVTPDLPRGSYWNVSVQPYGIVAYTRHREDVQKVYIMEIRE